MKKAHPPEFSPQWENELNIPLSAGGALRQ